MLDGARFAQRLWVRKNFLFPSLTLFLNMLVGRKLLPPCLVFFKCTFYYINDCQHAKKELHHVFKSAEGVLDRVM
jgi:hypothetical protein